LKFPSAPLKYDAAGKHAMGKLLSPNMLFYNLLIWTCGSKRDRHKTVASFHNMAHMGREKGGGT